MAHAEAGAEHTIVAVSGGHADPDGPVFRTTIIAAPDTMFDLPPASVVVIRGSIGQK